MAENLDEQLKELRALRGSLSCTLSRDAKRVSYSNQQQTSSASRSPKSPKSQKTRNHRKLDFPITARESRYVVIGTQEPSGRLPRLVYSLIKFVNVTYDLLGIMSLIAVPYDHTFKPPHSYEPPVIMQPTSFDFVEPS